MAEGNVFAYMRISTQEERKKQRYNRQEKALEKYAADHGIDYVRIYRDDASGKSFTDRKEWQLLEKAAQHKGDTIVFKDVSRFTREAEKGYQKYMQLMQNGVNLVFLDNPAICTDYIKQMLGVAEKQDLVPRISLENTVKLLLYVELDRVEKERLTLIQRTKDGIAASEKVSGRPKGHLDKMTPELEKDIREYLADRSISQQSLMKKHKISRNTLKKYASIIKEGLAVVPMASDNHDK